MAEKKDKTVAASFNELIQADRKKRKNERLAAEIFGRNRRQSAPVAGNKNIRPGTGGSLASRVGVIKRTASPAVPRSNSATPRNGRGPTRPPPPPANDRRARHTPIELSSDPVTDLRSENVGRREVTNGGSISFKGAAGGPYVVHASNFAPGTTAADIESVMKNLPGVGEMYSCRILAAQPTVIVEMSFAESSSADTVISTFNNKRADGRLLHVYMKDSGSASIPRSSAPTPVAPVDPPPAPIEVVDDSMDVDENTEAREAENRLREQRRGRDDDRGRRDTFPNGPRGGRGYGQDDYYRESRDSYQDRRYGYSNNGGGYGGGQGGYGGRGGGRAYGGGQGYR